jgi:hypothetical protein
MGNRMSDVVGEWSPKSLRQRLNPLSEWFKALTGCISTQSEGLESVSVAV